MNLHDLYSDPKSLLHYNVAFECVPELVWQKYRHQPIELKSEKTFFAKDAKTAYLYAIDMLKDRFPKGEEAISKHSYYAFLYAKEVLNSAFPKGEDAIAKVSLYSYLYARDILKAPFPKGEEAISMNSEYARLYAQSVLNAQFQNI